MRNLLLCALLVAGVSAEDEQEEPVDPLAGAIDHIVKGLMTARKGVFVGMPQKKAREVLKDRANMVGELYLPLADTQYRPAGRYRGSLRVQSDDKAGVVDQIELILLTGDYDIQKTMAAVIAAGKKVGLFLGTDEDDPRTLYDERNLEKDLWVALGKGVIVFEVSVDV